MLIYGHQELRRSRYVHVRLYWCCQGGAMRAAHRPERTSRVKRLEERWKRSVGWTTSAVSDHRQWLIEMIVTLVAYSVSWMLMFLNYLTPASASPTPSSTHVPATTDVASQGTSFLQIVLGVAVGVAALTVAILGFRLAHRKEKREAQRDLSILLAHDPMTAIQIN